MTGSVGLPSSKVVEQDICGRRWSPPRTQGRCWRRDRLDRAGRQEFAPDDLAGWLSGAVPVPTGTQPRHQEQAAASLLLEVGHVVFGEIFGCRRLWVGVPDLDQDAGVVLNNWRRMAACC